MPFHDAYWATTIERWRREGMPPDRSPEEYFGSEIVQIAGDYSLQVPFQMIEETDRYRVGNIDVRNLAGSREAIESEIRSKVTAGGAGGGYIYHSDHSVPKDVSLENYRFALKMLEKYGRYD